jgi:hypothetical protein
VQVILYDNQMGRFFPILESLYNGIPAVFIDILAETTTETANHTPPIVTLKADAYSMCYKMPNVSHISCLPSPMHCSN